MDRGNAGFEGPTSIALGSSISSWDNCDFAEFTRPQRIQLHPDEAPLSGHDDFAQRPVPESDLIGI